MTKKRKRAERAPPLTEWWIEFNHVGAVVSGEKKLVFVVNNQGKIDEWSALVLETSANTVRDALAAHAHDVLGTYGSVSEAQKACEKYAQKWLAKEKKAKPGDWQTTCDCGTIGGME